MAEKVRDLRSALERLRNMPGQLAETDVEVDPMAELAGVYRYVGAGGTVKRPTKEGPAMISQRKRAPGRERCDWCSGKPETRGCPAGLRAGESWKNAVSQRRRADCTG